MSPNALTRADRRPPVQDGRGRWKFVALVSGVAVALVIAGIWTTPVPLSGGFSDLGPFGAAPAIAGVAVAIVVMVPRTVVAVTAGALFGWGPGAAYVLLGALLGASLAFGIGRLLGRDFTATKLQAWSAAAGRRSSRRAAGWLKRQLVAVDAWLERDGVMGIWIIRMVPVTHYGVTSYAAGAAAIRYRHFLLGTLLATIPGAVGFTAVGGAVVDPDNLPFAGGVATAVGVFGVVVAWLVRRHLAPVSSGRARNPDTAPSVQEG